MLSMRTTESSAIPGQIAALLERNDVDGLRAALVEVLSRTDGADQLRALDAAGLLTRIIPELEPSRGTDQPHIHFLPVLGHSLEAVTAVEWLLRQIGDAENAHGGDTQPAIGYSRLPAAIQANPELRYTSVYRDELRQHFAGTVGAHYPRAALFKLGALLHDVAKPQTKQDKPDGGVSFHEHQTIGGDIAVAVAQRLRFDDRAAGYIRTIVREHMRPGQLAVLDELTLRAVQRFFHATGDAGPDVLLHLLADHMATRGPNMNVFAWIAQAKWIDALLDMIWGEEPEVTPPLLDGNEIMRELGLTPGPLIGDLLAAIGEAQAGGEIATREEALALARRRLGDKF
jgi:poly(A) polymerase/tRNA nucleotidyltransferase (CCA-adding enzyme)